MKDNICVKVAKNLLENNICCDCRYHYYASNPETSTSKFELCWNKKNIEKHGWERGRDVPNEYTCEHWTGDIDALHKMQNRLFRPHGK